MVIRYYGKICRKFVLRSFVNRAPGDLAAAVVKLFHFCFTGGHCLWCVLKDSVNSVDYRTLWQLDKPTDVRVLLRNWQLLISYVVTHRHQLLLILQTMLFCNLLTIVYEQSVTTLNGLSSCRSAL